MYNKIYLIIFKWLKVIILLFNYNYLLWNKIINNDLLENFRNLDINEKDVRSISIFPSDNFISISDLNSIKIL